MIRQDFPKRRNNNKHDFPAGLVLLGLFLVAIIWLSVFRPRVLESLIPQTASPSPHGANTATSRETAPPLPHPESAATMQASPREMPPAPAESSNAGGKQGDFFRYTDDQGVIHLVDNPDSIPEKYRQQTKVYRDRYMATSVRIANNQVLVPVTLQNGGRTVQATLVLDTGCSVTSISAELAGRLAIDSSRTVPGTARVADGRSVPASRAAIDRLIVGPKAKTPLEVSIMANAGPQELADGLLGMNFLRDFRYQIDTAGQQIHWR